MKLERIDIDQFRRESARLTAMDRHTRVERKSLPEAAGFFALQDLNCARFEVPIRRFHATRASTMPGKVQEEIQGFCEHGFVNFSYLLYFRSVFCTRFPGA